MQINYTFLFAFIKPFVKDYVECESRLFDSQITTVNPKYVQVEMWISIWCKKSTQIYFTTKSSKVNLMIKVL